MINLSSIDEQLIRDVAVFWNSEMAMKTMEECGELIQALSKYDIFLKSEHDGWSDDLIAERDATFRRKLIEEIRDVYISLEAIKLIYGINESEINREIEKKLERHY